MWGIAAPPVFCNMPPAISALRVRAGEWRATRIRAAKVEFAVCGESIVCIGAVYAAENAEQVCIMRFWERYGLILSRLGGGVHIPRHCGSVAVVAFVSATVCFGMIAGGHSLQAAKLAGSTVGLGVDKVRVSGNKRISEIDILQALGLDGDTALPVLNIDEARRVLAAMPWVERVSVRKIYPDTLEIILAERKPFALWQMGGAVAIIDAGGRVIGDYNARDGRALPLFVGRGAAKHAAEMLEGMKRFPAVRRRVKAYIRVADRRWDIILDNGLRIKLAEKNPFAQLETAYELDRREGLFSRAITDVDLRLEDRIAVSLEDEAYERHIQNVKEAQKREKAMKAGLAVSASASVQNAGMTKNADVKRGRAA